jgi:hypothetical protein
MFLTFLLEWQWCFSVINRRCENLKELLKLSFFIFHLFFFFFFFFFLFLLLLRMTLRKLKHHEEKLLKKVDFLDWKEEKNLHESTVVAKFGLSDRDEYRKVRVRSRGRLVFDVLVCAVLRGGGQDSEADETFGAHEA